MRLIRIIEEYNRSDEFIHKDYTLNITPEQIIEILDDLVLNEGDYEDEIYDPYDLTPLQLEKLKPFLKDQLNEDFKKYMYVLSYETEPTNPLPAKKLLYVRDFIELNEFNKQPEFNNPTNFPHQSFELTCMTWC